LAGGKANPPIIVNYQGKVKVKLSVSYDLAVPLIHSLPVIKNFLPKKHSTEKKNEYFWAHPQIIDPFSGRLFVDTVSLMDHSQLLPGITLQPSEICRFLWVATAAAFVLVS